MLGQARKNYESRPQQELPHQKSGPKRSPFLPADPAALTHDADIARAFSNHHKEKASLVERQFQNVPRLTGVGANKSLPAFSTDRTTTTTMASLKSMVSSQSSIEKPAVHATATAGSPRPPMLFKRPEESFSEASEIHHPQAQSTAVKPASDFEVWFDENDLSDDEDLELDIKAPVTMPLSALKPATAPRAHQPPPSSATVEIGPWSSSPPSHWQPKEKDPNTLKHKSAGDPDSIPDPAPKKRTLPPTWAHDADHPAGTPPPKRQNTALWNQTYSAVKDQKRQHRNQTQKKPNAAGSVLEEHATELRGVERSAKNSDRHVNTPITLSTEQERVLDLVANKNQSVFFTGPAGTGKSVLMRAIIDRLQKKWARDPERLAVTASTGLAACNIGGMTLHSFSGIGLGKEDAHTLCKKVRRNPRAKQRWLRTRTLIIDEISMVDGDMFDKLSHIGRTIRNNGRPWGGIQLVITGDFFQLPPVPEGWGQNKSRSVKFAYEADTWKTSIDHTIGLTQVFRQKDPEFAAMLNEMRLGKISDQTICAFKALSRNLSFDDGIEMTELFPTRAEVDTSNRKRLQALKGQSYPYSATDSGQADSQVREKLLSNMMAPKTLELKKGAQVMLIKNIDETLVNGSIGKIIDFKTEDEFQMVTAARADSSDDEAREDLALAGKARERVAKFNNDLTNGGRQPDKHIKYPIVEFGGRQIFVLPEDWKIELPTGEVQAQRKQLPLILAWALSIHKAQGQTLSRVKVDLKKVFEKGQAYVALSRATTQHGLQVLGFEKHKVMAHPKVVRFYEQLYSAEAAANKRSTAGSIEGFLA